MRILHLSDIHLNDYNYEELRDFYLDALIKKLMNLTENKHIDIVAITGDLIDRGGFSLKEILEKEELDSPYQIFEKEFIEPIARKLRIDKCNFLFIPGNHDIQENEINWFEEKKVFDYIKNNINDQTYLNKILTDRSFETEKRIKLFKKFEKNFHLNNLKYHPTNFESIYSKKIEGVNVGFILINDSWRCKSLKFSGECKKLFFGEIQLLNGLRKLENYKAEINICLMHHNMDDYLEKESIERTLNKKNISLILNGHYHEKEFSSLVKSNSNYISLRVGAGLNKHNERNHKFKPSFQLIDLNLKTSTLDEIKYFVYNYKEAEFEDISKDIDFFKFLPKKLPNNSDSDLIKNLNLSKFNDYE